MPPVTRQLILASTSPRRRLLLDRDGIEHRAISPGVDDAELTPPPNVSPRHWVAALAYLKARAGLATAAAEDDAFDPAHHAVLAADTVCVADGVIIGQPESPEHAISMIRGMADSTHHVLTGFALLTAGTRVIGVESAKVDVGPVPETEITRYVASGAWHGKAGGYNLEDRIDAGWPINYDGEATSIMGLPMNRIREVLCTYTPWVVSA